MKDWDYYDKPTVEYYGFDYRKQYRDELIKAINDAPMTKLDRDLALSKVDAEVRKRMYEVNKPYNEAIAALIEEFWADAKAELGYDDFLDAEGIEALESLAYEEGHAYGFSSVFAKLSEFSDFAQKIAQSTLRKAIDK